MAKKTYRTYHLKGLQLMFKDADGKRVEINFRGGIQVDSTAKFTTSDKDVQEFLESCSGFNRDYYLDSVAEENVPVKEAPKAKPVAEIKEEPLTDVKDIKRFKNIVEMRAAIKELGIDISDNCSYAEAKAAAKKEGYDFQIQK